MVENPPAVRGIGFNPWVGKIPWGMESLPPPTFLPGESHGQRKPGAWQSESLPLSDHRRTIDIEL